MQSGSPDNCYQDPTGYPGSYPSRWYILPPILRNPANKQTKKQTDKQKILSTQKFELSTLAFLAHCSYRLSYRAVLIWLLLSDYYYQITIIRLTKKFGHTEVRTLDPRVFSIVLLPTELKGRTKLITLIRLLLSDYYYPGSDWNLDPKIRPVDHEKQLSGSQIRISIRITPNFELGVPMIITSLLTKFRQNPTSSLWEILLTNIETHEGDCNIPLFAG